MKLRSANQEPGSLALGRAMLLQRLPVIVLLGLLTLSGEAAFGMEPKVAVAVGQSGEAIIVDATMDVQVPLETAWEVLTDFDHMTSILGNLTSSKVVRREETPGLSGRRVSQDMACYLFPSSRSEKYAWNR